MADPVCGFQCRFLCLDLCGSPMSGFMWEIIYGELLGVSAWFSMATSVCGFVCDVVGVAFHG